MASYTWTYIRIDKMNAKQVQCCLQHVISQMSGTTYAKYLKMSKDEYVKEWIDMHKKNYDYLVNTCGMPLSKMTDEYLTKEIHRKMKRYVYILQCYEKVLNGEMKFDDMCRKTHQLSNKVDIGCLMTVKHKGHYYAYLGSEIFRNREFSTETFDTVEGLINYLSNPKHNKICDCTYDDNNVQPEYGVLSEALKEKIIKYYSEIGNGNFVVQFG